VIKRPSAAELQKGDQHRGAKVFTTPSLSLETSPPAFDPSAEGAMVRRMARIAIPRR
jgi:hypothetical protein